MLLGVISHFIFGRSITFLKRGNTLLSADAMRWLWITGINSDLLFLDDDLALRYSKAGYLLIKYEIKNELEIMRNEKGINVA